jgi:hypothetical protein
MIGYYIGGWLWMAALFSGGLGSVNGFYFFVSVGSVFLILNFLYEVCL